MPKIKHIQADLLSDEELSAVSDMFDEAERRMDEKLMKEIDSRKEAEKRGTKIWTPFNADLGK